MTKCSHDIPLEHACNDCLKEGLSAQLKIPGEHLVKETMVEATYYPDHDSARTESATFRHTKALGHKAGLRCSISGQPSPEYHHIFCEYSYADAVDWLLVKGVGMGYVKELPVLDPITDLPTGETFPVQQSLIWIICKLAELRGFDWAAFDATEPGTFVDSMANMLPLSVKFHRSPTHGIHHGPFPTYIFQAFPRKPGFVFTADEEVPVLTHQPLEHL